LSTVTTGHAYGIGVIVVIITISVGIGWYQMFYLPELLAKPQVSEHILEPPEIFEIEIIPGSASQEQLDNYVPKLASITLEKNNHVVWTNADAVAHTVTPDHRHADSYSGDFGSPGVIMPGNTYEFLFTETQEFDYHCEPHPWMTGKIKTAFERF